MRRHARTARAGRIFLVALLIGASTWACQPSAMTETESFEHAEVAYREGHYRAAIDGYEAFLERYPRSPLAKIARLRIRCINREVRSMLGRTGMPRPLYRGEPQDATLE